MLPRVASGREVRLRRDGQRADISQRAAQVAANRNYGRTRKVLEAGGAGVCD